MTSVVLLFLAFSLFATSSKGSSRLDYLCPGDSILEYGTLLSDDRTKLLAVQDDGNMVIYKEAGAGGFEYIWNTGTTTVNPTPELQFHQNGSLVLYDGATVLWSMTEASSENDYLILQNDGNLVKYNGSGAAIWSSGSTQAGSNDNNNDAVVCGTFKRDYSGTSFREATSREAVQLSQYTIQCGEPGKSMLALLL